jgi:hypothetical protein
MTTTPPSITGLPAAPDPNDRSTFNARAYPWSAALPTFGTQVSAVADNVKANADEAVTAASAATTQAQAAASSAAVAGAVAWVSGTTYDLGDARYSPLNMQTYRRRVAGAGTTDPSSDLTNWAKASAMFGTADGSVDLLTGASIASASTLNLNAATGNRVHITGSATITAVTLTLGPRTVIFDGVLTLTHHATNNNLPGGANIVTAVGDRAIYESDGVTVYCVSYIKASGSPVISGPRSALVLLATLTPTAAANIDFLNVFSGAYDNYLIIGNGVTFGTTDGLSIRLATAGSADTSSNYVNVPNGDSLNSSVVTTSLTVSSGTTINAAGKGCNFEIEVLNANDSVRFKGLRTKIVWNDSTGTGYIYCTKLMAYIAANAATGIRLIGTNGSNFAATGKICVYGYANT